MENKICKLINKRIIILDGASGTELNKRGMPNGACPEKWCIENPRVIGEIHSDYEKAGADIIYACTFGANRVKLSQYKTGNVFHINKTLASIARKSVSRKTLVAGDIGPTGNFVRPFGNMDFEEAVNVFKEQVKGLLAGGVDLFVIETMMDIQEARAALIAVRELTDKFTMVTMTYEKHGRTLGGNDPASSIITLQSLGANAVGCNCSTGPIGMKKIISEMTPYAKVPIVAKPNAGMPKLIGQKTYFDMDPKNFAILGKELIKSGASIIGGCCGTTPRHIYELGKELKSIKPKTPLGKDVKALSSARSYFIIGKDLSIIGERINPTGKKQLKKELLNNKMSTVRKLSKEQEHDGANLLDVNVGTPGINEKKAMLEAISNISIITDLPLVIDSSDVSVIEKALRFYPGRALINSISGEGKKIDKLLKLAKKYGAMFILLPILGKKIPETLPERKRVINKILKNAFKLKFTKNDIVIDALTMSLSSDSKAPLVTLDTIKWCSEKLRMSTVIGLSNVSFGMPSRSIINSSFLYMAKKKGLTLAIADPSTSKPKKNETAIKLLLDQDKDGIKFIKKYSEKYKTKKSEKAHLPPGKEVYKTIVEGERESMRQVVKRALDSGEKASYIVEKRMIPAIVTVGKLFDKKEYFLPQLIASAETMKEGFKMLEPILKKDKTTRKKKAIILMATVKGDIHDIGKNIVSLVLENHGFKIIDLGKDVSSKKIIQAIIRYSPDIVGLSALMTTTMVSMKEVVNMAKREGLKCKFMVGGAVLDKAYAGSIGAEYGKDGVEAVKLAKKLSR